jgi:hypothetical protein
MGESSDPLVVVVSLDYTTKQHEKIAIADTKAAMEAGKFVWIDVDVTQVEEARKLVTKLELCAPEILERVDAMMGASFLLTLHRGAPVFLEAVRKS